jgi:dihydropteroate synthase
VRSKFKLAIADGAQIVLGLRTVVAGVLNVTPDSFSDGGQNLDPSRAVDRALEMEAEGADIVEIGGESTRPDAAALSVREEIERITPVLAALRGRLKVPLAVDTYKSEVARAAIDLGAGIVNDVSALRFDPAIADTVARSGAGLVLMHMRGDPSTMQKLPPSPDIFAEVTTDLGLAVETALSSGVRREQLVIDPGIGFGKTLEDNLAIINHLERFSAFNLPLMIGTSRKSFIGRLTGKPASERMFGTAASVVAGIVRGVHIVRVHDVKEMVEVTRVADAIFSG